MLLWDSLRILRDQSLNRILWTLGSLPEPHFLRWDQSQTLIGTSHFHMGIFDGANHLKFGLARVWSLPKLILFVIR